MGGNVTKYYFKASISSGLGPDFKDTQVKWKASSHNILWGRQ